MGGRRNIFALGLLAAALVSGGTSVETCARSAVMSSRVNSDWQTRVYSPKDRKNLAIAARKTMDGELSACGTTYRFPDGRIDWRLNPSPNGYREWMFHVARHKFWTTLAEYYSLTGDERAVSAWLAQIRSWMEQMPAPPADTPPTATEHWRTIDVGIRMKEWSRQIAAFIRSPQVTDEFLERYFHSVREHGLRLRRHSTNGNWLMSELTGLLHVAVLYPFLEEASEWHDYALGRMKDELARQVYPDGFQYELTPSYHAVVIDNYLETDSLFGRIGMERPAFIRDGLARMFDVLVRLRDPQGRTPAMNDSRRELVRPWLKRAVTLYPSRADYRWCATDGKDGSPPACLSCAFPYAGVAVFRSSWSNDAVWACFDGGPFGRQHQHEDKLNFVLQAYGTNMLVEGQSYLYDTSEMRRYVVSTRAHNTIRVDGLDQNTRKGYRWHEADIHKKSDMYFSSDRLRDTARAAFTAGYGKDKLKVAHERTVIFLKNEPGVPVCFVIVDRLSAPDDTAHSFEVVWHLEDCKLRLGEGGRFEADFGGGVGLFAATSDSRVNIEDMRGRDSPYMQGWVPVLSRTSPAGRRAIPTPVVQGTFSRNYRLVTVLEPYRGTCAAITGVAASQDPADRSFLLRLADGSTREFSEMLDDHGQSREIEHCTPRGHPVQWIPDVFPSYVQRFEATFASSQEAADAICTIAKLPGDAELAFGCRWDDTVPAHVKKAEMMNRVGVRGTFYLCADETIFFKTAPGMLMSGGHAIGNHTYGHPFLPSISPNAAFRAIAANRVILETNIQHTVMSYVMPFGWGGNPVDPDCIPSIAASIVATGHFVTQDNPVSERILLDAECYMPTWRFSADDHNPSRKLFEERLRDMQGKALASPTIPRLGFGTHSWCDDIGNDLQKRLLEEFCVRPEWAQLNDWQYGAYRYEVLHGGIRKLAVDGNKATFEATRFFPSQIGADMALSLKFSPPPLSVLAEAKVLAKGERGTWILPHAADAHCLDCIACAGGDGTAPEFSGLKATISPDEREGMLRVHVENRTGRDLRRICVTAAFPPKWVRRGGQTTMELVRSGENLECAFEMGRVWRKDYAFGMAYYPVSIDFMDGTKACRLWCEASSPRVEVPASLPSRAARVWGPSDTSVLDGVDWLSVSVPGAALPDAAKWKLPDVPADSQWNIITRRYIVKGTRNVHMREMAEDPNQGRFIVYDFEVPDDRMLRLRTSVEARRRNVALYVNGKRLRYMGPGQTFAASKGRNRVILRADMKIINGYTDVVYFCVTGLDGFSDIYSLH